MVNSTSTTASYMGLFDRLKIDRKILLAYVPHGSVIDGAEYEVVRLTKNHDNTFTVRFRERAEDDEPSRSP